MRNLFGFSSFISVNRLIIHGSEANKISHAINLKQNFIGEKYDVFNLIGIYITKNIYYILVSVAKPR